jgi:hypothetical protein
MRVRMIVWMIVRLQLLLEITNIRLELLALLLESLDPLFGVGVLVTSFLLNHKSSWGELCYSARLANATPIDAVPLPLLVRLLLVPRVRAGLASKPIGEVHARVRRNSHIHHLLDLVGRNQIVNVGVHASASGNIDSRLRYDAGHPRYGPGAVRAFS